MGKPNKYGARKTHCDHGHLHDSAGEAARCNKLHDDPDVGPICQQPEFDANINGKKCFTYRADFGYMRGGVPVIEDYKGMRSGPAWAMFRVKQKIIEALYGLEITVHPEAKKKRRKASAAK